MASSTTKPIAKIKAGSLPCFRARALRRLQLTANCAISRSGGFTGEQICSLANFALLLDFDLFLKFNVGFAIAPASNLKFTDLANLPSRLKI